MINIKKFLTMGLILAVALLVPFFANSPAKMDATQQLSSSNFNSAISANPSGSFTLSENIALENWKPINFSGSLNGNGFKIFLSTTNLFVDLNGAEIKNLGIEVVSDSLINYNTSANFLNTNFGLLAQSALNANISQVYVWGKANVLSKSSTAVGALVGFAQASTFSDCYAKTSIEVTQTSAEALQTVAGGFIGQEVACKIYNCFSVPFATNIVSVKVLETLEKPKTQLIIGGFIGMAEKTSVGFISNIFSGGTITYNFNQLQIDSQPSNKIYVGKILGYASGFIAQDAALTSLYTFNQQELAFVGNTGGVLLSGFAEKDIALFGERANFILGNKNLDWNIVYEWNLRDVWTKKDTSTFLILQVFETFNINLDSTLNDEGVVCTLFVLENGGYVETQKYSFKFGDKLRISISISEKFSNYKMVQSLIKTDSTEVPVLNFTNNRAEATYDFDVNAKTAGLYYSTAENIEYTLVVKTENAEHGYVKYGTSNTNQTSITYTIVYGGEYTFVADPIDSSFAFGSWFWMNADGEGVQADRGGENSGLFANRAITIAFGEKGNSTAITYLGIGEGYNIPYTVAENGSVTFTIQAGFTQNVAKLEILCTLGSTAFNLYVGGVLIETFLDLEKIYSENVQIGRPLLISIEMKEGYVFDGWQTGNGTPIENLIGENETKKSTTINLLINNDFSIEAVVHAQVDEGTNLLWLWISLGCAGGVGLIVLLTIVIVKAKKRRSFINNY